MMSDFNSKYFRDAAWSQLSGQRLYAALVYLVYELVYSGIDCIVSMFWQLFLSIFFYVAALILMYMGIDADVAALGSQLLMFLVICLVGFLIYFLISPLVYSFSVIFLENKREGTMLNPAFLFKRYKGFTRVGGTMVLMYIYTMLWSFLFCIPAIVKGISYSQTLYVLHDNPELSYNKAIERSMSMMDGYKMRYFKLLLSFTGWILLCLVTLGIASFWVIPYLQAAKVHFYEFVKEEYEKKTAAAAVSETV